MEKPRREGAFGRRAEFSVAAQGGLHYHDVVMRVVCVALLAVLAVGCIRNHHEPVYAPNTNTGSDEYTGVVEVDETREPCLIGPAPRPRDRTETGR